MTEKSGVQGVPTWFGPERSRLFGVVHMPTGGVARAGVVICPPLGRQHLDTYSGLKLLAQRLSANGFAVLRFDYPGTGDSVGDQCRDSAVDDYLESIRSAIGYLKASGVQRVALVGLRIGALLAASVAPTVAGVEGVVLWDPVTDGRRYLREQQALYQLTVGAESAALPAEPDVVPILGITFSAGAAKALGALRMPAAVAAPSVLLLTRPERSDDSRLAGVRAQAGCEAQEIAGQAEFIEPPSVVVRIPMDTVAAIEKWLDANFSLATVAFHPILAAAAVVDELSDGREIVESIVELGPDRLFAIRTALAGAADDKPIVLLHNTACEHRVGSGRIWPESARELAGLGVHVVRYDRRGVGDSGLASDEHAWIHSADAKADVIAAVEALAVPSDRLMMTGICSGAWNSAYAAAEYGAKLVVLLNILLYSWRRADGAPERISQVAEAARGESSPRGRRVWEVVKQLLRDWLPYPGWLLLGRLGYTQAPEVLLKSLGERGVRTELVLSPSDFEWYQEHRGPIGVRRLASRGWDPKLTLAPGGDHAVLHRGLQIFIRRRLMDAVLREFADQL